MAKIDAELRDGIFLREQKLFAVRTAKLTCEISLTFEPQVLAPLTFTVDSFLSLQQAYSGVNRFTEVTISPIKNPEVASSGYPRQCLALTRRINVQCFVGV